MKRIIGLLAMTTLMSVGMAGSAQAYGNTGWHYHRCNSGLYVTVQTRTTQNATVEISTFGQTRSWGNYWKYNTFNTRISHGYWRAYTGGQMDLSQTYAYCSPY